jgi:hypothetical protein
VIFFAGAAVRWWVSLNSSPPNYPQMGAFAYVPCSSAEKRSVNKRRPASSLTSIAHVALSQNRGTNFAQHLPTGPDGFALGGVDVGQVRPGQIRIAVAIHDVEEIARHRPLPSAGGSTNGLSVADGRCVASDGR